MCHARKTQDHVSQCIFIFLIPPIMVHVRSFLPSYFCFNRKCGPGPLSVFIVLIDYFLKDRSKRRRIQFYFERRLNPVPVLSYQYWNMTRLIPGHPLFLYPSPNNPLCLSFFLSFPFPLFINLHPFCLSEACSWFSTDLIKLDTINIVSLITGQNINPFVMNLY